MLHCMTAAQKAELSWKSHFKINYIMVVSQTLLVQETRMYKSGMWRQIYITKLFSPIPETIQHMNLSGFLFANCVNNCFDLLYTVLIGN